MCNTNKINSILNQVLLWIFCVFTYLTKRHPWDSIIVHLILSFMRSFIPSQCHPEIYSQALCSMAPKSIWPFFSVSNFSSLLSPWLSDSDSPPTLFITCTQTYTFMKTYPMYIHTSACTHQYMPQHTHVTLDVAFILEIFLHIFSFLFICKEEESNTAIQFIVVVWI